MNRLKRILCVLLSLSIIAMPVAFSVTASGAESISSLEQQLQDLEKQNQEYQDTLDRTESDINEKEEYKDALVSKIQVLDKKIQISHQKIDELNSNIEQKQADIDKANAAIETQMDTLRNRIRLIYMAGNASDLEIILGAKDFSDFIDKMELVKTLSSYDKELIDQIEGQLTEISAQKAELEADKADLESQEASLEDDQAELNTLLEENDEVLKSLYATNQTAKEALESAALESQEIDDQIQQYYEAQRKIQQQQQQQQSNSSSGSSSSGSSGGSSGGSGGGSTPSPEVTSSGYTWPCPGFYYLSSEWNEDRGSYNHGAIDIAGGGIMGSSVVAAESGYVYATYTGCVHNWGKYGSCGCGGGYGNYVMIDHGNGKTTVYGHLSSLTVSTGQTVSKGQTIGYVGSTGNSTGPHLHFECRLNGVKYNPMIEF